MRGRLGNNSDCPYTNTYETHTFTCETFTHTSILLTTHIHVCEMLASTYRNISTLYFLHFKARLVTLVVISIWSYDQYYFIAQLSWISCPTNICYHGARQKATRKTVLKILETFFCVILCVKIKLAKKF